VTRPTKRRAEALAERLDRAFRRGDWERVATLCDTLCNGKERFCYSMGVEAGTRAVGYARVSTTEQGTSGLGLDAQQAAITAHCDQRRWVLTTIHSEVASGAKRKRRPILETALGELEKGDILIVAKADRLARSLGTYVGLIDRARADGWSIVAADGSIDLTTPHGRAMAGMAAVFAELEAELIGDRTKVALNAARARGQRLGRPPVELPTATRALVLRLRKQGQSLRAIAEHLNQQGTSSPLGASWYPSTVKRVLEAAT
jgi:DNA invertase Pin-like site-specific DNA recombinase